MTKQMALNEGWEYVREPEASFFTGGEASTETVRLPHTGTVLPFNYTEEKDYQYVSGYRKELRLPALMGGRRLFAAFEGAAQRTRIVFNGETLVTHACGYTGFAAELTALAREGENLLALEVDSGEETDQPPFGNVIDYLTYQGVYRGCRLILTGEDFLADVFASTKGETVSVEAAAVGTAARAVLRLTDGEGKLVSLDSVLLSEAEPSSLPLPAGLPVKPEECRRYSIRMKCAGVRRWSPDHPVLYDLAVTLQAEDGKTLDERRLRVGFRDAEFREDGFWLNGDRLILRGLDRHQSFPYVGYAMPDDVQRRDAEILRRELGLNVVRTSHYPQSRAFLDRCDELGLLVFTEIPGWQHIGGDAWKAQALRNVSDMVWQDRNHPCVVLWGVRINESPDDDRLYLRTNELAHSLDPTRQTGGVRCIRQSRLLEDVYTYNDFIHRGDNPGLSWKSEVTSVPGAPYLVTEYCGHMYPTKSSDDEPHRLSHALRHARVLDAMYGMKGIAGCIGWCAFDYNTHKEFGSGDRVCYHGVMDMFRNPKPAAAVYASQADDTPVLELSGTLDKGDWPASELKEVWAFTNADSVRLYRDGVFLREFLPDRETFPNLPHPPIRMDDFSGPELAERENLPKEAADRLRELWKARHRGDDIGVLVRNLKRKWGLTPRQCAELEEAYARPVSGGPSYRFEAVRGGEIVATAIREPVQTVGLRLEADRLTLREEGMWTAAEVRITAVDQNGNRLWYASEPLQLELSGPLELIGPACIPLRGGAAGVWLRTTGEKGEALLTVRGFGPEQALTFTVE